MDKAPEQQFHEVLSQMFEVNSAESFIAVDARFRAAFLSLGSETEDNCQALRHITVSEFGSESDFALGGLQLARAGVPLSQVLNCAEGCPIPMQVQERYPDLEQNEWDAVLRVATMTLLAFESPRMRPTLI